MKQKFMVIVRAKLPPGFTIDDTPVAGYFQTLGVTARNEKEMLQIIQDFLKEDLGATLASIEEVRVPDFQDEDAELAGECGDHEQIGVWYGKGHSFFSKESDEKDS